MDSVTVFILVIVVVIVLFLFLREVTCWYFKINKREELMEYQNELLEGIYKQLGGVLEED